MKTNFEKWRDSLTPEAFAKQANGRCGFKFTCLECPALKALGGCSADVDIMNNLCDEAKCRAFFLLWANAPAKEEK